MDEKDRRLYELKAEMVAAAGHPLRLAIIDALQDGERCVGDLAADVEAERSNVSRHLAVMVKAGLLESRKKGLNVFYTLRAPCMQKFLACVTDLLRTRLESHREALEQL